MIVFYKKKSNEYFSLEKKDHENKGQTQTNEP